MHELRGSKERAYTAALPESISSQEEPARPQLPHTQRERACARNAGGREGAGSDTPGVQRLARKGEPVLNKPGLPINTISGVAGNSIPVLGRKPEACTLNLIGASGLCALPVHTESWTGLQR